MLFNARARSLLLVYFGAFAYISLFVLFNWNFRVVGGLLSAYDLSGDEVFLEKAKDIGNRLLPAWDTPSGIPYNRINLVRGNAHNSGWTGVLHKILSFGLLLKLAFVLHKLSVHKAIHFGHVDP